MIWTISDFIFIFNLPMAQSIRKNVARQVQTLNCLYLTPFEMVMVPPDIKQDQYKMTLYEDPVINLLCPYQFETEHLRVAGFSSGIIAKSEIQYDSLESQFTIDKSGHQIMDMFGQSETLLFIEIPYD